MLLKLTQRLWAWASSELFFSKEAPPQRGGADLVRVWKSGKGFVCQPTQIPLCLLELPDAMGQSYPLGWMRFCWAPLCLFTTVPHSYSLRGSWSGVANVHSGDDLHVGCLKLDNSPIQGTPVSGKDGWRGDAAHPMSVPFGLGLRSRD